MRWAGRRASSNIEDRRGMRYKGVGGIGIGTVILALIAIYFGQDPSVVLQGVQPSGQQAEQVPYQETAEEAQLREMVAVVLADTEDTWGSIFSSAGGSYREPTLVLFSGAVESACGFAQSAVGPFYCPADQRVYIDLSFYEDLQSRFGAPGDAAQAYVIAHEVGHRHSDAARDLGAQHGGASAREPGGSERALRATRVASGLLCRHLGASRRSLASILRGWRYRRSAQRRERDR